MSIIGAMMFCLLVSTMHPFMTCKQDALSDTLMASRLWCRAGARAAHWQCGCSGAVSLRWRRMQCTAHHLVQHEVYGFQVFHDLRRKASRGKERPYSTRAGAQLWALGVAGGARALTSSSHTFSKYRSRVSTKEWMNSRMASSFCAVSPR